MQSPQLEVPRIEQIISAQQDAGSGLAGGWGVIRDLEYHLQPELMVVINDAALDVDKHEVLSNYSTDVSLDCSTFISQSLFQGGELPFLS